MVADVHLGYEWARGAGGDQVPAHSLAETVAKLERVLERAKVERLIVAGDLVESARPCRQSARDVTKLERWLVGQGVELVALQGNHDPPSRPPKAETIEVAGWTIGHGHRPIAAEKVMIGHHHPVLKGDGVVAPCFLVGPRRIVLPAFSPNAAGLDVTSPALPDDLRADAPRCLAGLGDELLDFGPLADLVVKLRGGFP
ncbi:MAG TPA: phosphoesterase [Isosphaeraceae bacterium]|nr:phosphoesterase [Isosphaeraceae bacterium]